MHREVIAMEPPQLFFPEKITRLVTRDASLQSGKLTCQNVMWWVGLELAPQRPRFGLLGRYCNYIYLGSTFLVICPFTG